MYQEQRADILGCQVDLVSLDQALLAIKNLLSSTRIHAQIITVNAEILYEASRDLQLKELINNADLVTPDGIGVVWAARSLGYDLRERVTGIELLEAVCREGAKEGWNIFFFGSAPGIAAQAAENLSKKYPGFKISGTINGYFTPEEEPMIAAKIKASESDILFVGLGAPRQEYWINSHKESLKVPVCIGVGGSFDVIAGLKKRAPQFMIRLNLEWLYRLLSEPSRFKRQLALPKFVMLVLRQKYRCAK